MKKMRFSRVIALALCLMMCISTIPMSAFASIPNWEDNNVVYDGTTFGTNGYYNVISKKDYVLVPGAAVESEMVLNNAAGTRRQVIHVIEVDPSNPDVSIVPGYNQIDKDLTDEANWSHKELTEMAKYYENNLGYNIVGGMNTDLYYDTYAPRILVYNGKDLSQKGQTSPSSSILYVFQDADGNVSCDVKAFNRAEFNGYLADGTLLHAVGVSFGMVVKDGELVSKTEERTSAAAARSMVGVKEDGTLVICMNDGRGANNSVGFCDYEEGEAMLALGCQWAANCDGGGSSTFLTKRVGEETFTMRSVPCDGAQRPTAHGIFVTSNVAPTGVLDSVNVNADYDYFAPKTEYTFDAEAIDTHGYAMEMPSDVTWALSDNSFGTIENGTFVSNGTKGNVDVQVISGGEVVGSKNITIDDPEVFKLSANSTVVPYSTAEKVRTITLPIVAMTGEANVYVDANAVSVALSNDAAGTMDGFKFTATDDTSVSDVNVIVTYGGKEYVYSISFGKGSEIIFDFEDGEKAGFVGYAEAKKWCADNDVKNGLFDSPYPHGGQMDTFTVASTFVGSTEKGGQARNGNNALAWRFDNTDPDFEAWSYYYLYNIGESVVLRDVENGKKATSLGMWVYVPEDAFVTSSGTGFSFQSYLWVKNDDGSYSPWAQHFMFNSALTGAPMNLNSATNEDIPESRWVYASVDISKYNYVCTSVATDSHAMSPVFLRSYAKPKIANEVTFYIDDITLDYSSAVDDRILPTITAPTYSTADTAVALDNGVVIDGTKVAFSATVSDNSALDRTSGKIFVDGVEVKATVSGNTLSSTEDVALFAGEHKVTFEIADELGNPAKLTRTFTVAGDAVITLTGHNDSGEAAKAQSVYYVDIKASDIEAVKSVKADLKLQTANTWEVEGAVVANGFKADFDYNKTSQLLTVTVDVDDETRIQSEDDILVSIPVRIWTYNRYDYLNEKFDTAVCSSNKPAVNVDCEVVYGEVELANKKTSPFGGSIDVATNLTTISSPYHVHDEELTVLNKDATCTETGYENRTYCETCKSVVSWGIAEDASGHSYSFIDDILVCACGEKFTGVWENGKEYKDGIVIADGWHGEFYYKDGKKVTNAVLEFDNMYYCFDENGKSAKQTGLFDIDGVNYYAIAGNLVSGWQQVEDSYYYFDATTFAGANGALKSWKIYNTSKSFDYSFTNGKLDSGVWVNCGDGMRYYYGPGYYHSMGWSNVTFQTIDGNVYGFDSNGYRYESFAILKQGRYADSELYSFDENGVLLEKVEKTGIYVVDNASYYFVDGILTFAGLVKVNDAYYYFSTTSGQMATSVTRFVAGDCIDASASDMKAGTYTFGADGKMVIEPVTEPDNPDTPNTPVEPEKPVTDKIENGYYYVNGVRQYTGLTKVGDDYYYFSTTSGKMAVSVTKYITANCIDASASDMKAGTYTFDADGKMVMEPIVEPDNPDTPVEPENPDTPVEPEKPNVSKIENGYYYVNGVRQYTGLTKVGDDYYYFSTTSGKMAASVTRYVAANCIDASASDMKAGTYTFGADGKMVMEPIVEPDNPDTPVEPENPDTPVEPEKPNVGKIENGYYYVNGVRQYTGLTKIGDDYYYFSTTSGKMAVSVNKYVNANCIDTSASDMKAGTYTFGADGKLI